jgi:transposase
MLGRLTLENEFLKKALQNALKEQREKESSSILSKASSPVSKGGVS